MNSNNELFYLFFETKSYYLEYWLRCKKDIEKCKKCGKCSNCFEFRKIDNIIQKL